MSSSFSGSDQEGIAVSEAGIQRRLVLLLAVTAGVAVASNYYAQPLLATIAQHLIVSKRATGFLVTASQIGYALGLAAVVPLGDLLERRRLIARLLGVSAIGLVAAALSPNLPVLAAASLLVGVTSVVAQIAVPFAASLAADHERGLVVGTVMSGLLIGMLLARTFAGFVADFLGWRAIYLLAALLVSALICVLRRELPESREKDVSSYAQLMRTVWRLVREERVLQYRSIYGACVFAAFSAFWTTAAFLLSGRPYQYSAKIIGLFGLVAVSGVIASPVAGRLADRGWARFQTAAFLLCTLVSWLPIALGAHHLAWLVFGIILMDFGVHGTQITNQSVIYRLVPGARSRLTTAYMTIYFIGGAMGSQAGAAMYERFGWNGVCWTGAGFVAVAIIVLLSSFVRLPFSTQNKREPQNIE
ncbi:MAG TPA: MFS transporter [Acidobacteriota bacterium]|nr:MFS transporter [Acidobacteriota bacterium]